MDLREAADRAPGDARGLADTTIVAQRVFIVGAEGAAAASAVAANAAPADTNCVLVGMTLTD